MQPAAESNAADDGIQAETPKTETGAAEEAAPVTETMAVQYDTEKVPRKELAVTLAVILNTSVKYMGVATKAYQVGEYMISADGTLTGPKSDSVLEQLKKRGF